MACLFIRIYLFKLTVSFLEMKDKNDRKKSGSSQIGMDRFYKTLVQPSYERVDEMEQGEQCAL